MSEERKQERAGVSVEMRDGDKRVRIAFTGNVEFESIYEGGSEVKRVVVVQSLDDAEALRDALSAFIAFHKRGP